MMGAVERAAPVPVTYTAGYLRVSAGVTYIGSNAKARRELGYDPRPLEGGLRETLLHEMALLGMTPRP
jgi:nucleoside-diphosphate-sugar epimerase